MARIRVFLDFIEIRIIRLDDELIDTVIVVAIFRCVLDEHFLDALVRGRREIVKNGVPELGRRDALLVEHELLDRRERIRHVRDANLEARNEIVDGAALFDRLAAADAVIDERRAEDVRHVAFRGFVNRILNDDAVARHFAHGLVPCRKQFVIALHFRELAIALREAFAAREVDAVIHGAEQHAREAAKHKEYTGVTNELCLRNLAHAIAIGKDVLPRIPVIPGFNDSKEDADRMAESLHAIGAKRCQLLPFHQFGENKYALLGRAYAYRDVEAMKNA